MKYLAVIALILGISAHAAIVEKTGTLEILKWDDFNKSRSGTVYNLIENGTGKSFGLNISGMHNLKSGDRVRIRGRELGDVLALGQDSLEVIASPAAEYGGQRDTVLLLGNLGSMKLECTPEQAAELMFNSSWSVDSLYREISRNSVGFTGDAFGPFEVDAGSGCDADRWTRSLELAARKQGIDLGGYQHKIYVLPRNELCPFAGMATFGGTPGKVILFTCDIQDVYAHELGHNLRLHHASTLYDEYGDTSDFMGVAFNRYRGLNAPHLDQMGWLDENNFAVIHSDGIYKIDAIEQNSSQSQGLKIYRNQTHDYIYISYRVPAGFDSDLLEEYKYSTSIHTYLDNLAVRTYLMASLHDHEHVAVNNTVISQLNHTNESAWVSVRFGVRNSADLNNDYCIDQSELISVVMQWKNFETDTYDILRALDIWRQCR